MGTQQRTLAQRTFAALGAGALGIVAACSGGAGPGGTSLEYLRCTPYCGMGCAGQPYPDFFQCNSQPGAKCVPAPRPSPDPDQTVWCCEFACSRADPKHDTRCTGGRMLFNCNSDAKALRVRGRA